MQLDFVLTDVRLPDSGDLVDIGVQDGIIAAISANLPQADRQHAGGGRVVFPGFSDCHIHLDKAGILDRCPICLGTLDEAISSTKTAKAAFTQADVSNRASQVLEQAISHGTTTMRTFVEVDAEAGLRSLEAILRLRDDYTHAIDLQVCAFAQDGTTGIPNALALLSEALDVGADLVGGCPYADADPARHVADIFDLAERFGTAVDFHIDFNLDPDKTDLPAVIAETTRRGFAGKVALGHVTNLSMLPPAQLSPIAHSLAQAGIAVVALPATDLFLTGRDRNHAIPRGLAPLSRLGAHGVTTAIATNNVLNPFTPFGNASLMRMADLYLHAAQLRTDAELRDAFDLVTSNPRAIIGSARSLVVGQPATFVLLDAPDPVTALRRHAVPMAGWYRGRQTFNRPPVELLTQVRPAERPVRAAID